MARGYDQKDQSKSKRRRLPEQTDEDENDIYLWWYRYLRANDDYMKCCDSHGQSDDRDIRKTYEDFGDVRSGDFKTWWATRGQKLFEIPHTGGVQLFAEGMPLKGPHVLVAVPLEQEINKSLKQLRALISKSVQFHRNRIDARLRPRKTLELKLQPALLKSYLAIYLAKVADPGGKWQDWAAVAKITNNDERVLENDVSRRIRIAKQIVHNAGKGIFPKYNQR